MAMTTGSGQAMSEINVTPLVDVMLVLLIIFMVATPLIEKERRKQEIQENRDRQQRLVTLNLPVLDKRETPPPEDQQDVATVVMGISPNLQVKLNEAPISDCSQFVGDKKKWAGCFDKIEAALMDSEDAQKFGVSIDAAPNVPFGFVVGAVHRLRQAGIEKVGMMPRTTPAPPQ